jgi:hypothetical protein
MGTLEQFCGPPVSRNITELLCTTERLSRFNDLYYCSITLFLAQFLSLERIIVALSERCRVQSVLWLWLCLITLPVLKGSRQGTAPSQLHPFHSPTMAPVETEYYDLVSVFSDYHALVDGKV